LEVVGGISAAGGTFSGDIAASSIFATSAFYETANQIRVTNNARSWFL
jgi:hypothetical protein